ncbi:MAG TPA: 2-phospho-L-lactate guanylyltransferase [Candidatus Limnocylindria bacterium]|nr:2-phospho-L-lactate guanylyltransferase [Candidatus Limnocylindria bacterium]
MKLVIIVLARDPRRAKTRLRGSLVPAERERLATAMLDDVMTAATATGWPVLVVTDARSIAARAKAAGAAASVVRARGTRDGAARGLRRAAREGADAALVIAADIPLVRTADLRRIAAAGRRSDVVIVPDRRRSGTNALYVRPPSRVAPRFGRGSFAAHRAAAGARGHVLTIARIGLDVDTPADLNALRRARRQAGRRTRRALDSAG